MPLQCFLLHQKVSYAYSEYTARWLLFDSSCSQNPKSIAARVSPFYIPLTSLRLLIWGALCLVGKKKSFLPWKFRSCVLSLEQSDERKTSTATACPILILFWLSNLSPLAQTSWMLLIKSVAEGKTFASACTMRLVNTTLCPQKLLFYVPRGGFLLRMDLLVCGYKSPCKVIISCYL